ncbi:MAG: dihydropteroate synthase [Hyphomicrobiales bacterium]|nr:dihydropteroate synthase [Hyphomicrobiales bacterium]
MAETWAFLTGHLARPRLEALLAGLPDLPFQPQVIDVGVKVAALMTAAILLRRLQLGHGVSKVIVPGRCRADLAALSAHFTVPFVRGPDELQDLPEFLGRGGRPPDLSQHDTRIFAEIVDASALTVDDIVQRAAALGAQGADVIDLGCLPDTPFPHMEAAIAALQGRGLKVSIDSAHPQELRRAALAGADYLLSLTATTLDIAEGCRSVPVLVPEPQGDLASLIHAAALAEARSLRVILDPVLDPVHFGFAAALGRYLALRQALPDAELMMGTGNLTELTEADSAGVTAVLLGVCSELAIKNVLVVNVSPHTRRTIREHDAARRLMFAARRDGALPRGYGAGLVQVHDMKPVTSGQGDIAALQAAVKDLNFRILHDGASIHVFNAALHATGRDALGLYPQLGVDNDGAHAFYLGAELMKAEIALQLGKHYAQDEALQWGVASDATPVDATSHKPAGPTLPGRKGR